MLPPQEGGQKRFRITDPKTGRSLVVRGDRPPSEGEAAALFAQAAESQPQPTPAESAGNIASVTGGQTPGENVSGAVESLLGGADKFLGGFDRGIQNLTALPKALAFDPEFRQEALGPSDPNNPFSGPKIIDDMVSGIVGMHADRGRRAFEAAGEGRFGAAAGNALAAAIPLVGPPLADKAERIPEDGALSVAGEALAEFGTPFAMTRAARIAAPGAATVGETSFPLTLSERMSTQNPFKRPLQFGERFLEKTFGGGGITNARNAQRARLAQIQDDAVAQITRFEGDDVQLATLTQNTIKANERAAKEVGKGFYDDLAVVANRHGVVVDMRPIKSWAQGELDALAGKAGASPQQIRLLRDLVKMDDAMDFSGAHAQRSLLRGHGGDVGDTQRNQTQRIALGAAGRVEEAMEAAANAGDDAVRAAWQQADGFWKESVVPFYSGAVRKLAKNPETVGKAAQLLKTMDPADIPGLRTSLGEQGWNDLRGHVLKQVFEGSTSGELRSGALGQGVEIAEQLGAIRGQQPLLRSSRLNSILEGFGETRLEAIFTKGERARIGEIGELAAAMNLAESDIGLSIAAGMANMVLLRGFLGAVGPVVGQPLNFAGPAQASMRFAGLRVLSEMVGNQKVMNAASRYMRAVGSNEVAAAGTAMQALVSALPEDIINEIHQQAELQSRRPGGPPPVGMGRVRVPPR